MGGLFEVGEAGPNQPEMYFVALCKVYKWVRYIQIPFISDCKLPGRLYICTYYYYYYYCIF